jgi:hypothetical protein
MNTSKKISKQGLKESIKQAILETGGDAERAKIISEAVIQRINEIGYRGAALARGANDNATNQFNNDTSTDSNRNKMAKSENLILPALNKAIADNFQNLEFHFICEKAGAHFPITFFFKQIKYIDVKRVVIGGIRYREINNETYNCSIEYNFNTSTFYEVKFYGGGSIRRIYPLQLDTKKVEYKTMSYNFLSFISNYLYSVEDYQTNINNHNNT